MPRLLIIAALLSLWAAPALAADQEPWVDADRFKPSQAAPPPASAPAPAAPKATAPAPAKPDYGDQAEIQRRRKARLAYTQALDEFNAGRYQQAARLFLQHLAVFPENGQARQYLAQARRLQKAQTHGTLRVLCSPPAQVTVDGQLRGNTPLSLAEVPVGPHLVQVEAKGVRQGREVRIKPMTTVTVEFDLTPSEERIEVIRPSRNQPRAAPAPPTPAPVAKPAPPAPAAKPAPPAPAAKPAAPTAKPASPAPTSAASPAPVAQPAAPAQAAAPRGSYAAKVVPARFTPPPGWRVEENASARQVR
ncbi:MAG: PEGA domain-containing protein, partial [Desulfarculaceae bacterium]|nr:PEGA domain-containing protein [Desulfarculaceae bacterium]